MLIISHFNAFVAYIRRQLVEEARKKEQDILISLLENAVFGGAKIVFGFRGKDE